MKDLRVLLVVAGVVLLTAGGAFAQTGGYGQQAPATMPPGHESMPSSMTMPAQQEAMGAYLKDASGRTLYWFKSDTPGKSVCMGPCLDSWPVYFSEAITSPAGVDAKDFGTITRDDGKKQTTFRGYPLYYFAGDKKAGDTNGNNMQGVWFVVDPAAFPPKP